MNPQEQREALWKWAGGNEFVGLKKRGLWYRAKAQGYTACECDAGRFTRDEAKKHEYPHDEPVTIAELSPPNYLSDLNAVHELENRLEPKQYFSYIQKIYQIVICGSSFIAMLQGEETTGFFILHATAPQRCEALLKTLGLWKP